ncbi:MAG: MraY family glycosyltransferase [Desulfobacterales bacterium]
MDVCGVPGLSPAMRGCSDPPLSASVAAAAVPGRCSRRATQWVPGLLACAAALSLLLWGAVRGGSDEIVPQSLFVAAVAFFVSFSLTPLAARLARLWGLVDVPDARKIHARPTPLLGGAAVYLGFLVSVGGAGAGSAPVAALLGAAFVLLVTGILDDRREIPAAVKLMIQGLCTLLVMAAGIVLRILPAGWGGWAEIGNGVLTLLWIVGLTNAFNFFDGMDGLAAGLGALIACFLAAAAFSGGQPATAWIAVALAGSCLGFLPYNFRPGKPALVFLGDAGSTAIGFVLAALAVHGEWAESRPLVSFLCPILIFWVPIFDMVHITCDRILSGKVNSFRGWLEYVGRDHLHHRLADLLGSRGLSVTLIFLLSACFGLNALVLREAATAGALLLCAQSLLFVIGVTILERVGRRTPRRRDSAAAAAKETAVRDAPSRDGVAAPPPPRDAVRPHRGGLPGEEQKCRMSSAS